MFSEDVFEFLKSIEIKHSKKIIYNIRNSENKNDPELFKKLEDDIWEFRTLYQKFQYRLLAFWDKTNSESTLVISTHGFVKKQRKVPKKEIERAKNLRTKCFEEKNLNKL
ncbi:type II toxin-antitoxin system RelE/ParE family toxin [Flavobacterium nackdongense]|uniref:Type II toxin-antitoxin system RelE/ParE family toxin n=1 Tax=Flavobacterium nackdongense TaxID=2547394 RepID=A0A4P6YI77_9FLAO|nr:type II toxin-antitoxin system RelE/ParE family toxin [Flavobacterium nackdongense]QBN20637.1 type II toxin-antitoxin system RelE/ParE family toxin [Flavobacterium nackdongense]